MPAKQLHVKECGLASNKTEMSLKKKGFQKLISVIGYP